MSRPQRAEAPSQEFHVRLSPDELARVQQAAGVNHQTTSQFARDALMSAAEDCLEPSAGIRNTKPSAGLIL